MAGISGSGQKELLEAIAGLTKLSSGVLFSTRRKERILICLNIMEHRLMNWESVTSFVPEDRLGMGLVGSMGMTGICFFVLLEKEKGSLRA